MKRWIRIVLACLFAISIPLVVVAGVLKTETGIFGLIIFLQVLGIMLIIALGGSEK